MRPDNGRSCGVVWVQSLDLIREDGDKAEESVECQQETFLHSFLNFCIRDLEQVKGSSTEQSEVTKPLYEESEYEHQEERLSPWFSLGSVMILSNQVELMG